MELLDKQKYIFGSLFLLSNKLQVIGDKYLGEDDITTKQWFLSTMISQFGEKSPTLSEVAQLMGSSRQNVKQLAIKLEEKGFLKMQKDEQDARATRLVLTEKSKKFWENRVEKDNLFIRELFDGFDQGEVETVYKCFEKLYEKIEKLEML